MSIDTNKKRGRPPVDLLTRIKSKVEVTEPFGCWIWQGATNLKNPRYSWQEYWSKKERATMICSQPKAAYPQAFIRVGNRIMNPVRALKQPPDGVKMKRKCAHRMCVNPDHWTYPGEVKKAPAPTGDEILDEACVRYVEEMWELEDIKYFYGVEIADMVLERCL